MASWSSVVVLVILISFLSINSSVLAQNCGCAAGECCSRWGYCGKTEAYCGTGCKEGPCTGPTPFKKCGCAAGECCSQWGYCGTTEAYCGTGCKEGPCTGPTPFKKCGCAAGECCSQWGYCGTTDAYCGKGCQEGSCTGSTPATKCGCTVGECCSQWGYCGTTDAYCGKGCQAGPCSTTGGTAGGGGGTSVASLVTQSFFDSILNQADASCEGKNFYSRNAFLSSVAAYPLFGTSGTAEAAKQEIAAFFAHVTHETGHFCDINEMGVATKSFCQPSDDYPCAPGKSYYGRGPIQLTWNYNYGPAGKDIGFDGLGSPETVATDPIISFKTAMWFWMNRVHSNLLAGKGFVSSIRAINGGECNGGNTPAVNARVAYYQQYCKNFNVPPGPNLYC